MEQSDQSISTSYPFGMLATWRANFLASRISTTTSAAIMGWTATHREKKPGRCHRGLWICIPTAGKIIAEAGAAAAIPLMFSEEIQSRVISLRNRFVTNAAPVCDEIPRRHTVSHFFCRTRWKSGPLGVAPPTVSSKSRYSYKQH